MNCTNANSLILMLNYNHAGCQDWRRLEEGCMGLIRFFATSLESIIIKKLRRKIRKSFQACGVKRVELATGMVVRVIGRRRGSEKELHTQEHDGLKQAVVGGRLVK